MITKDQEEKNISSAISQLRLNMNSKNESVQHWAGWWLWLKVSWKLWLLPAHLLSQLADERLGLYRGCLTQNVIQILYKYHKKFHTNIASTVTVGRWKIGLVHRQRLRSSIHWTPVNPKWEKNTLSTPQNIFHTPSKILELSFYLSWGRLIKIQQVFFYHFILINR